MIPGALQIEVESALGQPVVAARAVGGGCISNATRVETADGNAVFLKWLPRGDNAIFACESTCLHAMSETNTVRVPSVIALSDAGGEFSWILLEWLEPGKLSRTDWESLGRALAAMHRNSAESFGWQEPNFIGSLLQQNEWTAKWSTFWRKQRLAPQLRRAGFQLGSALVKRIEKLMQHLNELASAGDDDGPSLLHGDLWGGNVHGLASGGAALIDPSSYYGHREVDLAMAKLFGGFDARFFDAYTEAWPLQRGHEERVHLYQLYYMLVHVNLFGGSYVSRTTALVEQLGW